MTAARLAGIGSGASIAAWERHAACRDTPVELFFPNDEGGAATAQLQEARDICATCPVLASCREHAIRFEKFGFWGGMTENERRRARSSRRRGHR